MGRNGPKSEDLTWPENWIYRATVTIASRFTAALLLPICFSSVAAAQSQASAPSADVCMPKSGLIYAGDIAAPPMEFIDEQGRPAGIHIDLIKALEQQLGVPITITMMPRAQATAAAQTGRAHLTTINRFESREKQFDFLAQTVRTRLSVLLYSDVRRVTGLNDLAGLRITAAPGSYTHELLLKLPPSQRPELILVGDRDEAAQIWADRGADGMAGSGSALARLARQQRQTDFVEVPFETIIMNFATRQGCGDHMASIRTAMQTLRDQGVVDVARERWANPGDGSLWRSIRWFAGGALILIVAVLGWNRTLRRQVRERTHAVSEALAAQQRLTTQAESATRAKSAFLATMSHEIRTPLNAVIGTASLLEQTALTSEQHELVDVIKKGGDSLLSVVSDVLDFSKIEADKLELDSQPFDVRSLMSDTVALVQRSAAAKGLQVQAEIDRDFPKWVQGDINRLRQVLLNLLSNATKFTERGRIGFAASAQPLDDDDARVTLTITVSDTGVGIPEDRLLRVFEPFTQADSSTTRRFGGTGLGLAISQHLIRLMGGTLRMTSTVGEGSTFTITLPVALAPAPAVTPRLFSSAGQWGHLHVLLAEDNPVNMLVQKKILTKLGVGFDVAIDGREAVALASANRYDMILLDLQMPVMDGLQAATAMRQRGMQTWLVAVTADVTTETRIACVESGFNDFISKPLTVRDVAAAFERAPRVLATDSHRFDTDYSDTLLEATD
jgi:signal transduction histidine kinase/ActR/RegA family two-component response regulator